MSWRIFPSGEEVPADIVADVKDDYFYPTKQTNNLFEVVDSSAEVMVYLDSNHKLHYPNRGCEYCGQTETSKYDACVGCGHGGKT